MTTAADENSDNKRPTKLWVRIIQSIGALIVTAFVLWFLFGVPGYILFSIFMD